MPDLTPYNRLETFLADGSSAPIEPYTRLERILAGQDIEPYNRLEHFAKQAASGGGGSLPPYTSADKGKVLTVGEGSGASVEPKWEAAGGGLKVVGATVNSDVNNNADALIVVDGVTLTEYDSILEFISNNRAVMFISNAGDGVYKIMMPDSSTIIPSDNAAYYSMTINTPRGEQTLKVGFIAK